MKVENVEELKQQIDIVKYISNFVDLRYERGSFIGLCPFHKEKTPSFKVNPTLNRWKCFGCGCGGDVIDFVQKKDVTNFQTALEKICKEMEIEVKEKPSILYQIKRYTREEKDSETESHTYLLDNVMGEFPEDHHIVEWIKEGISEDVLRAHDVRYSSDHTDILFPLYDEKNDRKIIAIKARTLDENHKKTGRPKYRLLGKMGKRDFLYWWQPNLKYIQDSKQCIIVEGEKAQMMLESKGVKNVVAAGSHFISHEQEWVLIFSGAKEIVFAYDKDVPMSEIMGQSQTLRHYVNCYAMIDRDNLLGEKDSPIDRGLEVWEHIYKNRTPV